MLNISLFLTDRCYKYDCTPKPYSRCVVVNDKAVCQCPKTCPTDLNLVCGTDGVTYNNECLMKQASCRSGKMIRVARRSHCGKSHEKKTLFSFFNFTASKSLSGFFLTLHKNNYSSVIEIVPLQFNEVPKDHPILYKLYTRSFSKKKKQERSHDQFFRT